MQSLKKFETYSITSGYSNDKELLSLEEKMNKCRIHLIKALREFNNEKTDLDRMISVE